MHNQHNIGKASARSAIGREGPFSNGGPYGWHAAIFVVVNGTTRKKVKKIINLYCRIKIWKNYEDTDLH